MAAEAARDNRWTSENPGTFPRTSSFEGGLATPSGATTTWNRLFFFLAEAYRNKSGISLPRTSWTKVSAFAFEDSRSVLWSGFRPTPPPQTPPETRETKEEPGGRQGPTLGVQGARGWRRALAWGRGLRRPWYSRDDGDTVGPPGQGAPHLGPPTRAQLPPKLRRESAPAFQSRPASPGDHTHSPDESTHPDSREFILQPSARSGMGAASPRDATRARLGLCPWRTAAQARLSPERPSDPRLGRTDALEPKPSSSLSLLPSPSPSSNRRIPISAEAAAANTCTVGQGGLVGAAGAQGLGGGAGLHETRHCARAHWENTGPAPPHPGRERSRACGGSARRVLEALAPHCRGGGPAAGKGAPGCCWEKEGLPLHAAWRAWLHPAISLEQWRDGRCPVAASSRRLVLRPGRTPSNLIFWRVLRVDTSNKLILPGSTSMSGGAISLTAHNPHTAAWRPRKEKCRHTIHYSHRSPPFLFGLFTKVQIRPTSTELQGTEAFMRTARNSEAEAAGALWSRSREFQRHKTSGVNPT